MKITATILVFLLSFLTAYPAVSNILDAHSEMQSCCSHASDCKNDNTPGGQQKGCKDNDCNPLISCVNGSVFTQTNRESSMPTVVPEKEKRKIFNDNLVISHSRSLWHPPN